MNDTKEQKKVSHETRVNLAFGISLGEWVISSMIGLGSAIVTAGATIRRSFAEEVKEWPEIKDLFKPHKIALDKTNKDFMNGKAGDWRAHQRAINTLKDDYALARDSVLTKKYGILTRGTKFFSLQTLKGLTYGTWQRMGFAGNSTEGRILFNSVIGAVVGSAMTLSFFNGVASRHKIEKIADAVEAHIAVLPPPDKGSEPAPSASATGTPTLRIAEAVAQDTVRKTGAQALGA